MLNALAVVFGALAPCLAGPPESPRIPVTDEYHGVRVTEDYRWLEDWNDKKVRAWSDEQNAYAREHLDGLPGVEAVRRRATELMSVSTPSYGAAAWAGGALLVMKSQPPKQQSFLVMMPSPFHPDQERVVLDPGVLDPTNATTIDWFVPSPDGTLVAVSMSSGGSESGDVSVYEVATGKRVFEVVPRVNGGTAGGSLAWGADGKGFYYSRYPRGNERPDSDMDFYTQVYYHELGAPTEKDRYEIGRDFPRIAEIDLACAHDGPMKGVVLASVQNGDGGEFEHFLRKPDGTWTQITRYEDRIVQAVLAPDGHAILVSRKGAPRGMVLRLDLAKPDLRSAVVIVPEGADVVVDEFFEAGNILADRDVLYVTYQTGGPSVVRAFDYAGTPRPSPKAAPVTSTHDLVALGGGRVMMTVGSYVEPAKRLVFDPAKPDALVETGLSGKFPFDFSAYEVVREFATSKDGTKVPVNIIRRKGLVLDGSHPLLVTGYGGYGVNLEPGFGGSRLALLEKGVVWAQANLRGGGEYGDEWHRAGNLVNKQNVFDDFACVVEHLHKAGYSTPARTAVQGGSNGGLLMGALMTQHPDLVKCVVSHVGIYDMLRVELSPNGAFNVTEFGTVKDPSHFRALRAYSPYHNVRDGVAYPPVLFLTGANDPRVDPMQSRKMTARLQAAGASAYLRTSANSGHGAGTALSERIEQTVDVNAFIFSNLGVKAD